MSTMNFSVPEDVKVEFNKIFAHENKSHVIVECMRQVIAEHKKQEQREKAIDALLTLRAKQKPISSKKILAARYAGRP